MVDSLNKEVTSRMAHIPITQIRPNPYQPRRYFDQPGLDELAASIKEYGVIQPITVRFVADGVYELVSGERRLRASRMVRRATIPAVVVEVRDFDSAVIALIENLQRKDLTFFEEAEGYAHLINEHNMTQEELASKIGKNQSTIANKLRLLKLPESIKRMITGNNLTERHARSLLKLPDEETQTRILSKVIQRDLNVSATEQLVAGELDSILTDKQAGMIKRRSSSMPRDFRIIFNTLNQTMNAITKSGIEASSKRIEHETCFEYIITIPKA